MRFRRTPAPPEPGVTGTLRSGRETTALLSRLHAGDIVVLDHLDLDGATAQALVDRHVAAVVNAAPSTSGRYPNLGPRVLVDAGVVLLDHVGAEVFGAFKDGRTGRVHDDALWIGDERVASGTVLDLDAVTAAADHARAGLAAQLADLVANTTGFLLDERDVLLDGAGIPWPPTDLDGRDVVVVVDAHAAKEELQGLRRFLGRRRPVLVGVEGGADLLLAAGRTPDLLVGDLRHCSEAALARATDVLGRGPRPEGLERSVTPFGTTVPAADLALLVCAQAGARSITVVGYPTTTEQVLDHGRAGAPSALLVRLGLLDHVVGARVTAALTPRRGYVAPALALIGAVAAAVLGAGFDPQLLLDRLP